MTYLLLAAAILSEVAGTLSLRMAGTGRRAWYVAVVVAYLVAFTLLSAALGRGLGIGVAYGIWAAAGVALTSVASRVFFKEPLTATMALGIACIIAGVLVVEVGAHP